jgi:serine/threonine protein kinase
VRSGLSPLKHAEADALALGEVLRTRCGFDIRSITGGAATREGIIRALQSLGGGETLLIHLAVHGQMQHGCCLFHAVDSDADGRNALAFTELVDHCALKAGYHEVAFILDACRSDCANGWGLSSSKDASLVTETVAGARDIAAQIRTHVQTMTQRTRQRATDRQEMAWVEVLYGCSDGEVCYEPSELGQGLFTYGLVGALADFRDESLDLRGWGDRAARLMTNWTRQRPNRPRQKPMHYSHVGRHGILVFHPRFNAITGKQHNGEDGLISRDRIQDASSRMADLVSRIDGGRLVLLHPIGEGGMGNVWLARDGRLDRLVALKRPSDVLVDSPHGSGRFLREARSSARLRHPSATEIYGIHEVKEPGKNRVVPIIEMEYIEGPTLREAVERRGGKGLPMEEVCDLIEPLCGVLEEAHGLGIIHRDVKPENILIRPNGQPELLDFGIAAAADGILGATLLSRMTMSGQAIGSLNYSAPEQLRGLPTDRRSDVYSIAATLYYALTGLDPVGVLARNRIAPTLVPVLEKATHPDPDERYDSMADFSAAFLAAGRRGGTRQYVHDRALCPHCGSENPEDYRHCRHCGGKLDGLFRPCPKCKEDIRVDIAFCGRCGADIALESRRNDLIRAREVDNWDAVLELALGGRDAHPNQPEFAQQVQEAQTSISERDKLLARLQTAQNDSERIAVLENLLQIAPHSKDFSAQLSRIVEDRDRLLRTAETAKSNYQWDELLLLAQGGTQRFPSVKQFAEHISQSETRIAERKVLVARLETAQNDSERIDILNKLLRFNPHNEIYVSHLHRLQKDCDVLIEKIEHYEAKRNLNDLLTLAKEGMRRFPKHNTFAEKAKHWSAIAPKRQELVVMLGTAKSETEYTGVLKQMLELDPKDSEHTAQLRLFDPDPLTRSFLVGRTIKEALESMLELCAVPSTGEVVQRRLCALELRRQQIAAAGEHLWELRQGVYWHLLWPSSLGCYKTVFPSWYYTTKRFLWKTMCITILLVAVLAVTRSMVYKIAYASLPDIRYREEHYGFLWLQTRAIPEPVDKAIEASAMTAEITPYLIWGAILMYLLREGYLLLDMWRNLEICAQHEIDRFGGAFVNPPRNQKEIKQVLQTAGAKRKQWKKDGSCPRCGSMIANRQEKTPPRSVALGGKRVTVTVWRKCTSCNWKSFLEARDVSF